MKMISLKCLQKCLITKCMNSVPVSSPGTALHHTEGCAHCALCAGLAASQADCGNARQLRLESDNCLVCWKAPAESHRLVPRSMLDGSMVQSIVTDRYHGCLMDWSNVTDQISVQVTILQKPILECKTLFFPLSPFLIVKVDVSALKYRKEFQADSSCSCSVTCSYSSLMILGSSCL